MRKLSMVEAVYEAMDEEMARDERVFLIGEDVGTYGSVWLSSRGLIDKYGPDRVRDTPISEAGLAGLATGAAMAGFRPIIEVMYFDFITACIDPIVNQAAKADLMSGWQMNIPLVIRTPEGIGTREAGQHSQFLEAWFCSVPGIKVLAASNAYDAKGLLKSAIRDDSPVLFLENRNLYYNKEEVPDGTWEIPIGKAEVRKEGKDITLLSYGLGVRTCEEAQALLPEVDAEIINLRSIVPLDIETILASVKKTGRVVIVHEAFSAFSVGSEIVRRIVEEGFDYLDAEPVVYGQKRTVTPFSYALEDDIIISPQGLAEVMKKQLKGVIF